MRTRAAQATKTAPAKKAVSAKKAVPAKKAVSAKKAVPAKRSSRAKSSRSAVRTSETGRAATQKPARKGAATQKARGATPSRGGARLTQTKAAPLQTYRAKRDPRRTPEPMGHRSRRDKSITAENRFVIQEHHARSLHWDLRLERGGVLVSWALPKGLPEAPDKNHLAVHTEDHPLEYATFQGEIPKGEYGGGLMRIWDTGTYDVEKWSDREVKFSLHGPKSEGSFVLFQTKDRNWMIHRHGASTRTDPLPTSLAPMLATAGQLPTDDPKWAFEIKWDGIRAVLFVEGGRVRAQSRNDLDVTASFPELADLGEFLGLTTCVLDGEIVALGADGRPNFARLQRRMHVANPREARRRAGLDPVSFVAFDVLYLHGRSLLAEPYDSRRADLESLQLSGETFTTTDSFRDVRGADILAATVANGLEGVVAKRRDSLYRPGRRTPDWVKVKSFRTQEVVIGGWTDGRGERQGELGALLLGVPGEEGLRYVGKVGTGFGASDRAALLADLRPLVSRTNPFATRLPAAETAGAHYVRPSLVGEVAFSEWTAARRLRQPSWRGLRPDKSVQEVVEE
jgi:bifunctional non-homologous end joining protein LigD